MDVNIFLHYVNQLGLQESQLSAIRSICESIYGRANAAYTELDAMAAKYPERKFTSTITPGDNQSSIYEMQAVSPDNMVRQGTRLGKIDRNIATTQYKNQHPVKVRFHRTKSEYADSIAKNGLLRKSGNYGVNTADSDAYEPVIWTSDNPDEIPVLRRYMSDGRNSPEIETFRIDIPKDKYYTMKRKAFPNGRTGGMVDVDEGKDSLSKEGKHYSIDVFAEDIPPKYLNKMKKNRIDWSDGTGTDDEIYQALARIYNAVHGSISNMDAPDEYDAFEKSIGKRILSLYPDEIHNQYAKVDVYNRIDYIYTIMKKYYPTIIDAINIVNKIGWYLLKMNKKNILSMEFSDSPLGNFKILNIDWDNIFKLLFNSHGECVNPRLFSDIHAENGILVGEVVDTMGDLVNVVINNDGTIDEMS